MRALSKRAQENVNINPEEQKIFDIILKTIAFFNLGTTARVAGGWVRDKIMSKQSKDIDIAVDNMMGAKFADYIEMYCRRNNIDIKKGLISAKPDQGKNLETAIVYLFGNEIEIVNLRDEKYDGESRHPETIITDSPIKDAFRRDFTINSLFYNINKGQVEDFTGTGIEDIKNGVLRTPTVTPENKEEVGRDINAKSTFLDDPLRIMRAIRFANRYNLSIDPEIVEAARDEGVQDAFKKMISRERIEIELRKIMSEQKSPRYALELIREWGLRDEVLRLPENYSEWEMDQNNPHHELNLWDHLMEALDNLQEIIKGKGVSKADRFILNWATLLHDIGKLDPKIQGTKQLADQVVSTYYGHETSSMKAAEHLLRNLPGTTVNEIERIKTMIDAARRMNPQHIDPDQPSNMSRKALGKILQLTKKFEQDWERAIEVAMADAAAHKKNWIQTYPRNYWDSLTEQFKDMPKGTGNMKPLLSGNEIMQLLGKKKGGPWLGTLMTNMVEWQMENPEVTREDAKKFVLDNTPKTANRLISKRAAPDKQRAGIFARLPKGLAKQFPSLGEHDDSDPHVTVLYIGEVPNNMFDTLEGIVKDVAKEHKPFEAKLDDKVSYFPASKHSDGCKVAKLSIISKDLHKLNKSLKKALSERNFDFANHFPVYKPHITLEYMKPPKEKYDTEFPKGSWKVTEVEIWGCGDNRVIKLGKQKGISKRAEVTKEQAQEMAINTPKTFFDSYLGDTYPDLVDLAAKNFAKMRPALFLDSFAFHKAPKYLPVALNNILKDVAEIESFFGYNLDKQFPDAGRIAAERLAQKSPLSYFNRRVRKVYPEFAPLAAKELAKSSRFFTLGYYKEFPEAGKEAAARIARERPGEFMMLNLFNFYPEAGKDVAKDLAETRPFLFFDKKLDKIYPDFKNIAAKAIINTNPILFFDENFAEEFPQLAEFAAKKVVEKRPVSFFARALHLKFPDLAKDLRGFAQSMLTDNTYDFFKFQMHKTYPELITPETKKYLEDLLKFNKGIDFFKMGLHKDYKEMAFDFARKFFDRDPKYFLNLELHKTYPEIAKGYAKQVALNNSELFFDYDFHLVYPDLVLDINTIDEKLSFVEKDNVTEDNFYSVSESKFQTEQRHPDVENLIRYDFAINRPLGLTSESLEKDVLSNLYHQFEGGHTKIGLTGSVKSWALVTFPEPNTVAVEQIQSDLPVVLSEIQNEKDNIIEKYGEEQYYNFIDNATRHAAVYPFIVISKLAEMAKKSDISQIKISDFETIMREANIGNERKAKRIYQEIPKKLGFTRDGSWWVYTGDMESLMSQAEALKEKSLSGVQIQRKISPNQPQKQKSRLLDTEKLKPFVESVIGDRANNLNFSEDIGTFMQSLNKSNDVNNREKNQIRSQISKFVKAAIQNMLIKNGEIARPISKFAKVLSDKPSYKKKEKSESGGIIYRYDDKHIEKRWKEKKEKLKKIEKDIKKVREKYQKDLSSDNDRTRAIAAIVGIMDDTAMRIGNEDSAREGTYGASTLKVKHVKSSGSNIKFNFPGKGAVEQNVELKNKKVIKVIKDLMRGKKKDDFIFQVNGKKIWDRAVNRYLADFNISAKDLRGFHANRLMREFLNKKKDFKEALDLTAEIVGHKASTLKSQYLDPELVQKHEKKAGLNMRKISKRVEAGLFDEILRTILPDSKKGKRGPVPQEPIKTTREIVKKLKQVNVKPGVKLTNLILDAWLSLKPFLPQNAVLTSGFRTLDDQRKIIDNYWKQKGFDKKHPDVKDYTQKSRILSNNGILVNPPKIPNTPRSHLRGTAFDISGANLNQIAEAVRLVSRDPRIPVKLRPLVEPKNNAVHVGIDSARFDVGAVSEVYNEVMSKKASRMLVDDLKASGAPEEVMNAFEGLAEDEDVELGIGDMGFGIEDMMGDWFEKAPMFRYRHNDEVPEYKETVVDDDPKELAKSDPEEFFYRGLHREYPEFEAEALKGMIEENPKFYFIFKYNEREEDEFKELFLPAAEKISKNDPRAFFYLRLHHNLPELGRGAIVQLIDTNPDSFFHLGLDQDYPDYIESASNARNIKDPNKVELEKPEWLDTESNNKKASSVRYIIYYDKSEWFGTVTIDVRVEDTENDDEIVEKRTFRGDIDDVWGPFTKYIRHLQRTYSPSRVIEE